MDVQEIGPGCRLYLPVQVDGALFYLGDCHAVQGDGELCGIGAIEIRTLVDSAPGPARRGRASMAWPRIEGEDWIGAIALRATA